MRKLSIKIVVTVIAVILLSSACNLGKKPVVPTPSPSPTATQLSATQTPIPVTSTVALPTATLISPTLPPTATPTVTYTPTLTPIQINRASRITFLAGSISAIVETPIKGGATARYVLAILGGQTLSVVLTPATQDVFLAVSGADGTQFLKSSDRQTSWSGKLPSTQDYFIDAVSTGKDTTFTLQIIIPSLTTSTPAVSDMITAANVTRLVEAGKAQLDYPNQLYWSSNNQQLMVFDQNGMNLVTPGNAGLLLSFKIPSPERFLDFSSDGTTVALAVDATHVELRSLLTWKLLRTIQTSSQLISAVFSSDGHTLAVVNSDKIAADLYDVSNGNLFKELTGFQTAAPVFNVRFSPDNHFLIWISRGIVQTQEIATGKLGSLLSHTDFVGDASITPDNTILATTLGGQVNNQTVELIKLWNPVEGSIKGELTDVNGLGGSLSFSPDGKLLAAAAGKTFAIWDITSRKKLVVLNVDTDAVSRVAFSPDGRVLATASADGWVRLWRIRP